MSDYLSLDFELIKQEIKNYIRDNSELLADYNYEGSAISSMVNVLAYVTQYNMHYLNMIATELSITTAKKASSIYKLANMLNYLPKRNVAPYINVTVTNNSNGVKYLNLGNTFEANGVNLVYMDDTLTIPEGTTRTIKLYDGELVNKNWLSDGRAFQTYTLTDRETVDNNLLFVGVSDEPTTTTYEWENINVVNPIVGGRYYYIDYLDDMKIKFDDGSVYKKPNSEETVSVMYLKTTGAQNNGYILTGDEIDSGDSELSVIAITDLIAGENAETLDEIKNRAILFFTTQNRAITKRDYYTLFRNYSKIAEYESYSIYGGENVYIDINGYEIEYRDVGAWPDTGYVYFSILKKTDTLRKFDYLTDEEKNEIIQYFTPYKIITIFFKFVEPIIVYLKPRIRLSLVSYVGVELNVLEGDINTQIYNNYSGMDMSFRWSNLVNWIDSLSVVDCCEVEYDIKVLVKKSEDITYKVVPIGNKISALSGHYIKMTYSGFEINDDYVLKNGTDEYLVTNVTELEGLYYFSYLPLNGAPILTATSSVNVYNLEEVLIGSATVDRVNEMFIDSVSSTAELHITEGVTDYLIGSVNCDTGFVIFYDMENTLLKFMNNYVIEVELQDDISIDINRELFLCPVEAEFEYV